MAEEVIKKAKDPDELPSDALTPEDAEAEREGLVWARLCKARGLNADMIVKREHTVDEYHFIVNRDLAAPVEPEPVEP